VNIVLFESPDECRHLPKNDYRARHIIQVLRLRPGDRFDVGVVDGPRGKATLREVGQESLHIDAEWDNAPADLPPVELLLGVPRPLHAKRILRDVTTLGVRAIRCAATEKGERSYLAAGLWTSGEYREYLRAGAEQAFCTRLPEVTLHHRLERALEALPEGGYRLAMDNYAPDRLAELLPEAMEPVVLAVGSERGWSDRERSLLREAGFRLGTLGDRVLRTETACTVGLSLVLSALGRL
jgi:16S rRNA (uracil1498-N3)-methyltransferase